MIGTALKSLASQFQLAVSSGMAYGYLQGSFVTLTEGILARRMSIYVGSVNVPLAEGEELSPAAQCSALIVDMITKASGEENVYSLLRNRFLPALVVNHSGSVVTINFTANEAGLNGLKRFIAEMLPRITPLTAPLQCSHCGGHTGGHGYPVRIAPDTVVPMHSACLTESTKAYAATDHTIPGIIGAAVGALIGTAAWVLLFRSEGIITALCTLIILLLTIAGYKLLRGKPGKTQTISLVVCAIVSILLGIAGRHLWMLHNQYLAYGSVVSSMMRESVYLRVSLKGLFSSSETILHLILDCASGLLYAACGAAVLWRHRGSAEASKPQAMPGQA